MVSHISEVDVADETMLIYNSHTKQYVSFRSVFGQNYEQLLEHLFPGAESNTRTEKDTEPRTKEDIEIWTERNDNLSNDGLDISNLPCLKFRNFQPLYEKSIRLFKKQKAYLLVFKPFKINYDGTYNSFPHCIKKISKVPPKVLVGTREIKAAKVHYNFIVQSKDDLLLLHEKHTNHFRIHVQTLASKRDIETALKYILKESKERYFLDGIDYVETH